MKLFEDTIVVKRIDLPDDFDLLVWKSNTSQSPVSITIADSGELASIVCDITPPAIRSVPDAQRAGHKMKIWHPSIWALIDTARTPAEYTIYIHRSALLLIPGFAVGILFVWFGGTILLVNKGTLAAWIVSTILFGMGGLCSVQCLRIASKVARALKLLKTLP